jgi:hypothetical protein
MSEKNENLSTVISKDKIWTKIKNYVYLVVFLIIFISIISASNLVLNIISFKNTV